MVTNKYNFQKLTPTEYEDLNIYESSLDFVFQEKDLKNVAITGSYGAGKSSVLKTYKDKRPQTSFLNISLAHFGSDLEDKSSNKEYSDTTLEGKILNQLIHQIDSKNIPQTHFKLKRNVRARSIWLDATLISLFIILVFYIFGFNAWSKFVQSSDSWLAWIFDFSTKDISVVIAGLISVALLAYALYGLMKMFRYNKIILSKFKLKGSEIEVLSDDKESYFDKYLNEVLYLFENAKTDVIVFEDMDRFNNIKIFEKLREINSLINKKSSRTIRFFYLLRDDIFVSKDRTKFFDYMIPIVPIVDGSNSYDMFIRFFEEGDISEHFDKGFLRGLSLYIDDMRILKNIYNEYVIYNDQIQTTELDCNKLLAIISYKNIFPRDFSELQLGRGFVYTVFSNKDKFIEEEKAKLDIEIKKKQDQISAAKNELCNSIDELDALYFPWEHPLKVDGDHENKFSSIVDLIKAMKDNPDKIDKIRYDRSNISFDFEDKNREMTEDDDYQARKQAIEDKSNKSIEQIDKQIDEMQQKKTHIETRKFNKIITRDNIERIFGVDFENETEKEIPFKSVKLSSYFSLIKYLIRNGYIDEKTYPDYMTYFYENSLSRIDKIFLRSVTDEVAKAFSYELKKPEDVISQLQDGNFNQEEILNFDLLEYLLKSNGEKLPLFINQIKNDKRFDFILQFWSIEREKERFIKIINHYWTDIFKDMLVDNHFSNIQKRMYIVDSFYYSTDEDILNLNVDNCLTEFISNDDEFLNISDPDSEKIISKLNLLEVEFKQINYERSDHELFMSVYESNLYQISMTNISLMLEKVYDLSRNEEFKHRNYTLIVSQPEEQLAYYIEENMDHYIDIVLENCDSWITDDVNQALHIVNDTDISSEHKSIYISYLQTKITSLNDIDNNDFWSLFLQHNLVEYSVFNILEYYLLNGLDSLLVDFINNNDMSLDFDSVEVKECFGDNATVNFYSDIISCHELFDTKYSMIMEGYNNCIGEFSFENIPDDKIQILITLNVICMNEYNLQIMRETYSDHLMSFIYANASQYAFEVIDSENFSFNEFDNLLDSDIGDSFKLKLLENTSRSISVEDKSYSEDIICHILERNFDTEDILFLINEYEQKSSRVKESIYNLCIKNINEIIDKEYDISYELLVKLFKSEKIDDDTKRQLLILQLPDLYKDQAKEIFTILDMSEFSLVFEGKNPKIVKTNHNEQLLKILRFKGWISSFKEDEYYPDSYRAMGRRLNKRRKENKTKYEHDPA
ncbi:hypothetical protein GCM10008983_10030 [Lentibacillus halophilus]|uniref:YobI-like P-loop NTPase domain-containing protein n=1 Tax=Lentibacillus halophilus TaxID=295065 RepID=A0ABN0Z6Q5_9BACI